MSKIKIGISVFILLGVFAAGRYSVPTQPAITQQLQDNSKEHETVDQDTHKTIVRVKEPSGKVTTTVTIDTTAHEKEDKTDQLKVDTTVTPPIRRTLNLSVLAGTDIHALKPIYGLSIQKELIGPLTFGIYGLNNGVIGGSIGYNF
jgi:hypothetical protein